MVFLIVNTNKSMKFLSLRFDTVGRKELKDLRLLTTLSPG